MGNTWRKFSESSKYSTYDDGSLYSDSSMERAAERTFKALSREVPLRLDTGPKARAAFGVRCLECGKQFTVRTNLPECPKCGGSDIDLA